MVRRRGGKQEEEAWPPVPLGSLRFSAGELTLRLIVCPHALEVHSRLVHSIRRFVVLGTGVFADHKGTRR